MAELQAPVSEENECAVYQSMMDGCRRGPPSDYHAIVHEILLDWREKENLTERPSDLHPDEKDIQREGRC